MFNLLSEKRKKAVLSEYNKRRLIVGMFMLSIVVIISLILLSPSFVLSENKMSYANQSKEKALADVGKRSSPELTKYAEEIDQRIKALAPDSQFIFSQLIESVIINKKLPIHISGIVVEKGKPTKVIIVGMADSRDALVSFKTSLESLGTLENIELPVSNLASDKDISFTISSNLKNE